MDLKIKFLKWSAGMPELIINRKTAQILNVHGNERVLVKKKGSNKGTFALLDVAEGFVKWKEIVVSSELKTELNLTSKDTIHIEVASTPESLSLIKKKLKNKKLTQKEIDIVIRDIVNHSISDAQISLFVSAMYQNGMSFKETTFLINSLLKFGHTLSLDNKYIADKHSIGGVPGNRTTPLVVSICAAGGLTIPKSSSKAITSAAGTADVIETLAKISFSVEELEKIIKKTNAFIVWGGALGLVPGDSRIIQIEKELKLDPGAQLLASIFSKKLAVGSKYIVIDIPYGRGAKVSKKQALELKNKFEKIGKHFKKKIKVLLTDGRQPIGNGIGPVLELKDILLILDPNQKGPEDLEEKSLLLSGELFELSGKSKKGKGYEKAKKILESGEAFNKFKEIIKAQGGSLRRLTSPEKLFKKDIFSTKSGRVTDIHNKKINTLARVAGCPIDKFSGVYLNKKIGEKIKKKEKILTIYSESEVRLKNAYHFYEKEKPIRVV